MFGSAPTPMDASPQCAAFRRSGGFRFLVALARCGDLLLCAKHLFVAAMMKSVFWLAIRRACVRTGVGALQPTTAASHSPRDDYSPQSSGSAEQMFGEE